MYYMCESFEISPSPATFILHENLVENFHQGGKGRHILSAIYNTGQTLNVLKFLPIRAGGEIGENFLLVK